MKKKVVLCIFMLILSVNLFSQNTVYQLKTFYEAADMDCYLDKMEENINKSHLYLRDSMGFFAPLQFELHKKEVVPMLSVNFVNTDSFNIGDNIYDYIAIDSCVVFNLALVDKRMNVTGFAHFWDGVYGYSEYKYLEHNLFKRCKLKHIIRNINKEEAEVILYCHTLRHFTSDNYGFMYIKESKIYVYRVIEKDVYELNNYLLIFYDVEYIRSLNYKMIPFMYRKDCNYVRHTEVIMENEKMICP